MTTYEEFESNETVAYGSPATSASVNKAPLFIKKELNDLHNYVKVKFDENPLAWSSSHNYKVGELCINNGVIYKALVNNINDEPNNDDWDIVDIPSGYTVSLAWSSSTNYNKFDVVTYLGNVYEAAQANSNVEPTNTTYWNLISQVGQTRIGNNFVKTDGNSEPDTDNAYDIGSSSLRFANIFAKTLNGDMDGGSF